MAVPFLDGFPYFPNAAGGTLRTCAAGTTTNIATYTDQGGGTANANPIPLDAAGYPESGGIWLTAGTAYRFFLYDSAGALVREEDNITASSVSLDSDLLSAEDAKGDALVTVKLSGGTSRTAHTRAADFKLITDFGSIVADGTDQTTAITTWLGTLGASASGLYVIPWNCAFTPSTVMAAMPVGVVFLDLSGLNDFHASGETSKRLGILSKDSAPNDTHWSVMSGHHAVVTLNNFGNAGSTSAGERKASVLWASGQFANGAADKKGFRGAAIQQFTKDTGSAFWTWGIRSLAPWVSVDGDYELWAEGEVISGSGVYRYTGSNHYVSTGAGTCGATTPVHTSGTVSDGGVSWTYVDSADRSVIQVREDGRILIGTGAFDDSLTIKPSPTDASGSVAIHAKSRGTSKAALLKLTPTDSGGSEVAQPYLRAEDGLGLRIMKSDGSGALITYSDNGGTVHGEMAATFATATDLDTTPSVQGVGVLYFANSGATSVTTLDDPSDGQLVELHFGNANTTLVHSTSFKLTGSVNVTPSAGSVVTMRRLPASISAAWTEASRSIK